MYNPQGGGSLKPALKTTSNPLIQNQYADGTALVGGINMPVQGATTYTLAGSAPSYYNDPYGNTAPLGLNTGGGTWDGGRNTGGTAPAVRYGSDGATSAQSSGDWAYLDDQQRQLDAQSGLIDQTERNGLTQLGDSYNREVSGANTKQSRALEDFQTKRTDTALAKDSAIGRVNTNARTLGDSLRRRIGMASGSGSSAYQITAPGAVARDASKNRTGVVENFGQNVRDLDTTEKRVKDDFTTLLTNLLTEKNSREKEFLTGVLGQRNELDNSRSEIARQRALLQGGGYGQVKAAMQPFSNAITARQSQIGGLFDKYRTPFAVKEVNVNAPNLRDYTTERAQIGGGSQTEADPYAPYGNFLKKTNEESVY